MSRTSKLYKLNVIFSYYQATTMDNIGSVSLYYTLYAASETFYGWRSQFTPLNTDAL